MFVDIIHKMLMLIDILEKKYKKKIFKKEKIKLVNTYLMTFNQSNMLSNI